MRTSPATSNGAAACDRTSKTGASVAMEILRRPVQAGGAIVGAGVVAIVIGFILR